MESGNASGVPGSIRDPAGLVIVPGGVFLCSHTQLHMVCVGGGALGSEWAITRVVF